MKSTLVIHAFRLYTRHMNQTFIFIGRSGSGKGTQAELLMDYLKSKAPESQIFYLESGQKFREFFAEDNFTTRLAEEIYNKGGLQPEFLAVWLWSSALVKNIKEDTTLVLDGTPRKLHEAHILDSALKFYKRGKPSVIYINVSRGWAYDRLKNRGRSDDVSERDINKRLDWFDSDVVPALSFFRDNPDYNFYDIEGEQTIEKVHNEILFKLKSQQ